METLWLCWAAPLANARTRLRLAYLTETYTGCWCELHMSDRSIGVTSGHDSAA
jgi:hypothetical protein